mgnify:FL=1
MGKTIGLEFSKWEKLLDLSFRNGKNYWIEVLRNGKTDGLQFSLGTKTLGLKF